MIEKLLEIKSIPALLVAFGCLLVFLSLYEVLDITKLSVQPADSTNYLSFSVGMLLIFLSSVALAINYVPSPLDWWRLLPKRNGQYSLKIGEVGVIIRFGRIEDAPEEDLVVLPANEYFDDTCMTDARSSLGSYVLAHFATNLHGVRSLVNKALGEYRSEEIEKETNLFANSYGTGTIIFLDRPLDTKRKVILAAVTTQRAGRGLIAREEYVFRVIRNVSALCGDKRIEALSIPLIGSGHGQLSPRVSLITLIHAIRAISRETFLRRITIYIYEKGGQPPVVSDKEVRMIASVSNWLERKARA